MFKIEISEIPVWHNGQYRLTELTCHFDQLTFIGICVLRLANPHLEIGQLVLRLYTIKE